MSHGPPWNLPEGSPTRLEGSLEPGAALDSSHAGGVLHQAVQGLKHSDGSCPIGGSGHGDSTGMAQLLL